MGVTTLVGAQYGSEGKGAIAARIANSFGVHIRTGAPNAGHTYYIDGHDERIKVVARSIPCGASNPNAHLLIGPGGLVDVDLLIEEVRALDALGLDVSSRLWIDRKCGVVDPSRHHAFEGGVGGYAHQKIGSTGEGIGPARMAKIARGTLPQPAPSWSKFEFVEQGEHLAKLEAAGIRVHRDTARAVTHWLESGANVLLEGTQGSGLSLTHGTWPYVTSTDTNSASLLADAGLGPSWFERCILVARSYPIRVAGPSGPLENELTWEILGVEPERTTVTKKVRRVGSWDDALFNKAVQLNGPTPLVALTFADYVDKEIAGVDDWMHIGQKVRAFAYRLESRFNTPVDFVGTGPDSIAVHYRNKFR